MYAGDTHITCVGADINYFELNPNHHLDNPNKWLMSIKLTLSTTKTEVLLIGSRFKMSPLSNLLELTTDNVQILQVSPVKLL